MRVMFAALAFCLGACQSTAPPSTTPYTLIDLTDDYAAFYDRTEGLAPDARVAAFKGDIAPLFPGFYDIARFDGVTPELFDARITRSFERFPAIRERYTTIANSFGALLAPAHASFMEAFPDAEPVGPIYLVHSLGEFDGGTRTINGEQVLAFGADVMARVHTFDDEQPFFHHELFHMHHRGFFADCDRVWCGAWQEGLAVYVAHELNPSASDAQLLLMSPQPIRPAVEANLATAVCAVRARFDMDTDTDAPGFFRGGEQPAAAELPPRFAYFVGYLAAREAGRTHSLNELAHLTPEQARPVVDAALRALADCPNAGAN